MIRFFIFLFLFPFVVQAQLGVFKYSSSTLDNVVEFTYLTPANDGGLWALGRITSRGENFTDAVVLRLDQDGDVIWSREYDAGTFQSIYSIFPTQDGGFIIGGTSTAVYFDMYLAKADANGDIEWSTLLGESEDIESGFNVTETPDGGYMVVGLYRPIPLPSVPFTETSPYVTKLDATGNVEWAKTYTLPGIPQIARDVIALPNGGYLISGGGEVTTTDIFNGAIMQLDEMGNVVWAKSYDFEGRDNKNASIATFPNGDIALVQNTQASFITFEDAPLIISRLNPQGDEIWSQLVTTTEGRLLGLSLAITPEEDILVASSNRIFLNDPDNVRPHLLKLSGTNGELDWTINLAEDGFEYNNFRGRVIAVDAIGNYAYLYQDESEDTSFSVAKVNAEGQGICAVDTQALEIQTITIDIQDISLQVFDRVGSANVTTTAMDRSFLMEVESGSLDIDLGPDQLLCADSTILLDPDVEAMSPTYLWQDGSTDSTFTVTNAGTYAVTITQDQCVAEDSIAINTFEMAVMLGEDQELCNNSSLTLQPSFTYEGTYLWNTLDTTSSITIDTSGSYVLALMTVCGTITDTIEVITPMLEDFSILSADSVCSGTLTSVTAEVDLSINVDWQNLDGVVLGNTPNLDLLIDRDTNLILTATDDCAIFTDTISIIAVPSPTINIAATNASCSEANGAITLELTGDNPPFAITWTDDTGMLIAENVTTVANLNDGTYELTLSDNTGCTFTESITIIDEGVPEAEVLIRDIDCAGTSNGAISVNILNGVAPFSFSWTQDGQVLPRSDAMLTDLAPGNYALTLTDANDCPLVIQDLILSAVPPLIFDIEANAQDCPGEPTGSIRIINPSGGTPPYLFSLNGSPFQIDTVFNNLASGQYDITMQDAQGCDTLITAEVPMAPPIEIELTINANPISIGERIELEVLGAPALSPSAIISWQSNPLFDLSCTDCLTPDATAITSGNIIVSVLTENGCTITDSLMVVVENNIRIYVPNAFSPNNDGINDDFRPFPGVGITEVFDFEIYNRWGGLVFQSTEAINSWNGNVNDQAAAIDVYTYIFKARLLDGQVQNYSGEVQLIR